MNTVNAGLGRFLQHVEVEPKLDGEVFVGFRVVSLQPADYWKGVDLRPGDVVLRVNSLPIERDSEAYAAFQTLKSADQLTILLLRDGVERELRWRIVGRGAPAQANAKPTAEPSTRPPRASEQPTATSTGGVSD